MHNSRSHWQGRSKLIGGKCYRWWGRLTGNPGLEFQGEQLVIASKLKAYHARSRTGASTGRHAGRSGGFVERRRSFHVVA